MDCILYRILRFILKPFYKVIFDPIVIGEDNISKSGPFILAGNHTSNFDAAQMIYGSSRVVHMLAKKELFSNFISNWFFRSMGTIPVDRSIHDSNAKNAAIETLKKGKVVGIFPEGTTNKENKVDLLPFKFGAVSIASKVGCDIVPFAICGKYKMFSEKIIIIYGTPYKVSDDLVKENQKLFIKVRELKRKGEKIYEEKRRS